MPTDEQIDAYMQRTREVVAKYGVMIQMVGGNPPWAYTVGLAEKHGHEVLLFAGSPQVAQAILNSIAATMRSRTERLPLDTILPPAEPGDPDTVLNRWVNLPVVLKRCERELLADHANIAHAYAGHDVEVVQMVFADRAGRLPHQEGYDIKYMAPRQPLLYTQH